MHVSMDSISRNIEGQILTLGAIMAEMKLIRESLNRLSNYMEPSTNQGAELFSFCGTIWVAVVQ